MQSIGIPRKQGTRATQGPPDTRFLLSIDGRLDSRDFSGRQTGKGVRLHGHPEDAACLPELHGREERLEGGRNHFGGPTPTRSRRRAGSVPCAARPMRSTHSWVAQRRPPSRQRKGVRLDADRESGQCCRAELHDHEERLAGDVLGRPPRGYLHVLAEVGLLANRLARTKGANDEDGHDASACNEALDHEAGVVNQGRPSVEGRPLRRGFWGWDFFPLAERGSRLRSSWSEL